MSGPSLGEPNPGEPAPGAPTPPGLADADEAPASPDVAGELDPASGASGPGPGPAPSGDAATWLADVEPVGEDSELAKVSRERDEYLDALRRVQADFENYKKRIARQQSEHTARAAETLAEKLLPVLDTADLALSHDGGDAVAQLRASLAETLGREGMERIDPLGEAFDPNVADAVAHEPDDSDGGGPKVTEVLRAGYRWKGRVLRPAMVKVKG